MSIEIVTHVYAGELPQYAKMLALQLSSIATDPPGIPVKVTVCATPGDTETMRVIENSRVLENMDWFRLESILLEPGMLGRRAIGRNLAAAKTTADVVWFTDVDHLFGPGCLLAAYKYWYNDPVGRASHMWYPERLLISRNHAIGDAQWEMQGSFEPEAFEEKTYNRPIGGVFIVSGYQARQGYLPDTKWQQPAGKMFGDFKDDVAYRKQFAHTVKVIIPNLLRIRHSRSTYPGGSHVDKAGATGSGGQEGPRAP